jgi:DNA-binding NtrC family response regulator
MAAVELFGGIRGAYTSLDFTNPGKVLSSYGGVLFLDELSTLSSEAQAKLLLFLEDGTVTPMGWNGPPLHVPVQIIAATNENLPDLAAIGRFRPDLFYRFRGSTITVPLLRDTKTYDLEYLIDYILQDDQVNPVHPGPRVLPAARNRRNLAESPGRAAHRRFCAMPRPASRTASPPLRGPLSRLLDPCRGMASARDYGLETP